MDQSNLTVQDIMENPSAFGAPTFDEFKRNREKWIGREDELLGYVDSGSGLLQSVVRRYKYSFIPIVMGLRGREISCKGLEEVERMAIEHGTRLKDLDISPNMEQDGGGKYLVHVRFFAKKRG